MTSLFNDTYVTHSSSSSSRNRIVRIFVKIFLFDDSNFETRYKYFKYEAF